MSRGCSDCGRAFPPDETVYGAGDMVICGTCMNKRMIEKATNCKDCGKFFAEGMQKFVSPARRGVCLCDRCARASVANCPCCGEPAIGQVAKLPDHRFYHKACLTCKSCSADVRGKYAKLSPGFLCAPCAVRVKKRIAEIKDAVARGCIMASRAAVEELRQLGVPLPQGLQEAMADTAATDSQERVLEIFRQWDRNGDGVIEQSELRKVLEGVGLSRRGVSAIFKAADKDKDGQVSFDEFVKWLFTPAPAEIHKRLEKVAEAYEVTIDEDSSTPFELLKEVAAYEAS